MIHGLYGDLFERIATAQEEMLKHCVEANTVVINGKKYGWLANEIWTAKYFGNTPMIFGLAADTANLPDDWDFIVQRRDYPPMSEFDKLIAKNREMKEKFAKIRELLGEEPT